MAGLSLAAAVAILPARIATRINPTTALRTEEHSAATDTLPADHAEPTDDTGLETPTGSAFAGIGDARDHGQQ